MRRRAVEVVTYLIQDPAAHRARTIPATAPSPTVDSCAMKAAVAWSREDIGLGLWPCGALLMMMSHFLLYSNRELIYLTGQV